MIKMAKEIQDLENDEDSMEIDSLEIQVGFL